MLMSNLANLERKFASSGNKGYAIIADSEIQEMIDGYNDMRAYFSATGHHMISLAFIMKIKECQDVLDARKSSRNGWKA